MKKGSAKDKKKKSISYAKWGYFFIAPFFIIYTVFSLIPLISTFYYSFFESYRNGLTTIGPNFVGFANYIEVFKNGDILKYLNNTFIMWIIGFVPQILVSMLLAIWFTSKRLNLKGQRFFKTVIYLPNLIMASAFSMLFFALFSPTGPINQILLDAGLMDKTFMFFDYTISTRLLVATMNFLMWFGNTTILLMAGIMGIDQSLFEAGQIDGATSMQVFFKITLPMLMPIVVFVMVTSLIGGLQMFDVPQILTNRTGAPNRTTMTLIMYLNKHLVSRNYGLGGAVSIVIFAITAVFSVFVYKTLMSNYRSSSSKKSKKKGAKV